MNKSLKDARMELWCQVWVAVASSSNVRNNETCANWADKALADFDKRFHEPKEDAPKIVV